MESAGALGEEGGRQTLKAQQRRRRQEGREKEETEPISDQEHTADGGDRKHSTETDRVQEDERVRVQHKHK